MMGSRLEGKVAIVTGAGQGIGRGVALALAKEGARVAAVGRTPSTLSAVVDAMTSAGGRAIPIRCDVSSRDEVDAMVRRTVEQFGALDIVVNNAQSSTQGLLEQVTETDIALSWETGALATFHVMQAAFPYLREAGGASVVNFGSSTAMDGASGFGAYAMAKEAIRGLSRVAAREWGRYGIRVNVVVPNAMSPAMAEFRDAQPDRFARVLKGIPLGRPGDPESDIGRAVVALASDDLGYMTGETLRLMGGA